VKAFAQIALDSEEHAAAGFTRYTLNLDSALFDFVEKQAGEFEKTSSN
jgi:hypothetical protein